MADLATLLPGFALETHAHLLPTLEQQGLTTTDLLSLDARTIAARTRLPVLDIARLVREIGAGLRAHLGFSSHGAATDARNPASSGLELAGREKAFVSTLDAHLDAVLGGGVPVGYVSEVVGERYVHYTRAMTPVVTTSTKCSGAGKTQFLLTLLLAAQLPPPHGVARPTIYISTEHALPTQRLTQLLESNPILATTSTEDNMPTPSLARILTLHTPDLETQEHILTYQLPVAVAAHHPGLIVLDSIAANYRDAPAGAAGLAARAASLQRTGALLRDLARDHDCAVVVSNHVADRFFAQPPATYGNTSAHHAAPILADVPAPASSSPPSSGIGTEFPEFPRSQVTSSPIPNAQHSAVDWHSALTLDHQQRFFTGWGADPSMLEDPSAKTPALGLVWATQIAARIAIVKEAAWGSAIDVPLESNIGLQPGHERSTGNLTPAQNGLVNAGKAAASARSAEQAGRAECLAEWTPRRWRRWMRLVYASWAAETPPNGRGVEFEIWAGGIRAVT